MRNWTLILAFLLLSLAPAGPGRADDETVEVPLGQGVDGIDPIFRRCFNDLREAGHDPRHMSAGEIGACMRPEIEAMAEFAYEISTAYAVSSLTRIAVETCTLEQTNALSARRQKATGASAERSTWRWLTDCLKQVRRLEHDEQTARLQGARRKAEKLLELERKNESR